MNKYKHLLFVNVCAKTLKVRSDKKSVTIKNQEKHPIIENIS